jgi:hypothetical protein
VDELMEITYRIVPTVSATGEPTWTLYKDWAGVLGTGSILLAVNPSLDVLERAIDHLRRKA